MPITLTSTGKIQYTDFLSAPAWLNAVANGDGSANVTGGRAVLSAHVGCSAYYVYNLALPSDRVFVVRTVAKCTSDTNGNILLDVEDMTNVPDTIYSDGAWTGTRKFVFDHYTSSRAYQERPSTVQLSGSIAYDTDYIWELKADGANYVTTLRDASTLASIGSTNGALPSKVANWWLLLGNCVNNAWANAYNSHDSLGIFNSLDIWVTGLEVGYHVDITDAADAVKAHATSSGTSVAVDCSLIMFPFDGKVKVYNTDGGTLIGTFTGSDIWGGDEYLMGPLDYGTLKAWGGDAWSETKIQYWDGGVWAVPVLKCWDGEVWQEIRQVV